MRLPRHTVENRIKRISEVGMAERIDSVRPQTHTVALPGKVRGWSSEGALPTMSVSGTLLCGPQSGLGSGDRELKQQRKGHSVALTCKEPRGRRDYSRWPGQRAPNLQGCGMVHRTPCPWGQMNRATNKRHCSTRTVRADQTAGRGRRQSPQ